MLDRPGRTGGKLVVDSLRAHGVEWAFCVPGESYLEVLDALYDARNEITLVSARHEHGAANMAESYAKLSGKVGICMVTRGPGACNGSIGVHTAFQDSTPMIMLVGQVPRAEWGREAFQEVDYTRMFEPVAKWVVQIDRTEEVPYFMAEAFRVAQDGRPGPVVVALPEDMLVERSTVGDVEPMRVAPLSPDAGELKKLGLLLSKAKKPILFLGGSSWTDAARKGIQTFAEKHMLPVCCSFRRHDIFDNNHANFIGEVGLASPPELIAMVKESDVVLAVGTRLGEVASMGYSLFDIPDPTQTLIHVLPGARDLNRVFHANLAIQSNMELFVKAANTLKAKKVPGRPARIAKGRKIYENNQNPKNSPAGGVNLGACMRALDQRLPKNAVITTDAGNFSGWVQRFLRYSPSRRFLGSTNGAMGYGVPAAVQASITHPNRMAIAMVGDGGFGMTGQEIATAFAHGGKPIIMLFNNNMYGTIRAHQEGKHPERVSGTNLVNPDFVAIAKAHGGHGELVSSTEDFMPAFNRAAKSGKPSIIEIVVEKEVISTRITLTGIREAAKKRLAAAS
jgi:acetolactate synthase I/II/III large subunit